LTNEAINAVEDVKEPLGSRRMGAKLAMKIGGLGNKFVQEPLKLGFWQGLMIVL
jgi:hypothetical protein